MATKSQDLRKARVRKALAARGALRPRLSVFRSSKNIYAQIIDDTKGVTVAAASSLEKDLKGSLKTGADKAAAAAIGKLIAEWQPERLVVGLPTHADGTPHEMTRLATKFGERLVRRFNLPVSYADERLTSLDAEARLRETGRNSKSAKPLLDAVAAQLILQTWFESAQHVIPTQPSA